MTAAVKQLELPFPGVAPNPERTCTTCVGWGMLEATDIFCGAGGSSLGLESVTCPSCGRPLITVTQALNHWPLAVEAHNANFPHADHDVHDVEDVPPSRFRRTDILWASPECTHHAYCRGPKDDSPEANRSRATFRDIVRFTEYHRYAAVIVENVIEARLWCDTRGHGPKCSCGSSFDGWRHEMERLGYHSRVVYFNSQFALPTPQSRDRMYVLFWRSGLPEPNVTARLRPPSWCSECQAVVRGIQTWKPASRGSVRDQPGMFEWGRYGSQYVYCCPQCSATVAPAVTGAKTIIDFGLPAERIGDREKPLADKTRERIKAGLERLGTTSPVTVQVGGNLFERRPGVRVWSVDDPLRTVVGTTQFAVVQAGGQEGQARKPRVGGEPLDAVTTENHRAIVLRYGGQSAAPVTVREPMNTVTAHDREIGVVTPPPSMLIQVNRSTKGKAVDRQASTVHEPTRTIAGHGELALVTMRNHATVEPVETPAATVTGGGYHHGLLVYNGNPGHVRDLEEPTGVVKSRDSQALLVPYFRTGVARPTALPTGTVTSHDREALVITDDDVDGCSFRMLQWHELLRAQAPHDHLDGRPYMLTAKRRDTRTGQMKELSNELRVKMIGNMVSSPVATLLGAAIVFDTLAVWA